MKKIYEGLRTNDLENLLIPLISIDEYESKLDDDAIVVGFYVSDKEPADDLNRFIQKSPQFIYDADVSPAPTQDGYFVCFVEFERNEKFYDSLMDILKDLTNLVNIEPDQWSFTAYNHDGVFELTEKNVYILIRKEPRDSED